jgi:WD40 repeat protein/serine/threonine protein kinase
MTLTSRCPPPEDLRRLLLGQLPGPEVERSEQHLRECSGCLQRLRQMIEQDTLTEALRTGAKDLQPDADTGVLAADLLHRLRETRPTTGASGEVSLPVPEHVGRYRILARLGAGGMGTVYKAEDPDLRRAVALKVPHFGGSEPQRELARQRFLREARAAAAIRHPHVCPIHDVGEYQGIPYVVMAFVEGQSLADRLAGKQRIEDPREAVTLACQLAEALAEVHRHDIVHRDLKPANVLLETDGRAVLTDFGLARPADDPEHLTATGTLVGTPAFMAPEQVSQGGDGVGPWTDQYNLGVLLYRMLTGRLPFEGPTLSVIHGIAHETPTPPSRFRPHLDAGLEKVILKAMARRRADRYESTTALARALKTWLHAPAETVPTRSVRRRRVLPLVAATVGLGMLIVGGLLARQFLIPAVPPGPTISSAKEPTRDPLSDLQAGDIPEAERFEGQPKGLVAVLGSRRWRHWGPVNVVAVSPDGKRVASSGPDGVRLWEKNTGNELGFWKGAGVAISSKDGTLAVGVAAGVLLLDPDTLQKRTILKSKVPPYTVAFSADGKTVAAVLHGPMLQVWDVTTRDERFLSPRFAGDWGGSRNVLALTPDGKVACTASSEGVKRWDVATGNALPSPPPTHAYCVALSPDGHKVAAGVAGGAVTIWNVADGRELANLTGNDIVSGLAFSPDGTTLAAASKDRTVRLWDVAKSKEKPALVGHRGSLLSVSFSPDGKTLASGGSDTIVRLWDVADEKQVNTLEGYPSQADLLAITPDGRTLAVGGHGYGVMRVMLGDVSSGRVRDWDGDSFLHGLALSPDGKTVATCGYQGVRWWDIPSGEKLPPLEGFDAERPTALAFAPKGNRLAAVCLRREGEKVSEEIRVWNCSTGKVEGSIAAGELQPYRGILAFSPDGTRVASRQLGGKAFRVWEVAPGKPLFDPVQVSEPASIYSLAFAPDGETLLSATTGPPGTVLLWDAATGAKKETSYRVRHEGDGLICAVFDRDGRAVLSAGHDGRILRWRTGQRLPEKLCQLPGPVYQLALTEDGRYLFTANSNGTVYVLRLASAANAGHP